MSFKLNCPYCGQRLEAEDEWLDLDVQCPNCSRDFTVAKPVSPCRAPYAGGTQSPLPATGPTKSCPYCGETILKVARKCKHCREFLDAVEAVPASVSASSPHRARRRTLLFFLVPIALVVIPLCCEIASEAEKASRAIRSIKGTSSPSRDSAPGRRPSPVRTEPELLLLSWRWHEEYGFAVAEGQVKNISSESLRNVAVVASFHTADGTFITSAEVLVTLNPILPGQTSPFQAMVTYNPSMQKADVTFKELLGGSIPWKQQPQ